MWTLYEGRRLSKSSIPFPLTHQVHCTQKCFLSETSSLHSRVRRRWAQKRHTKAPVYAHNVQELYDHQRTPVDLLRICLQVDQEKEVRWTARAQASDRTQVQQLLSLSEARLHAQLLDAIVKSNTTDERTSVDTIETDMRSEVSDQSIPPLGRESRAARLFGSSRNLHEIVRTTTTALLSEEGRQKLKRSKAKLARALDNFCGIRRNNFSLLLSSINTIACGFRRYSIPLGNLFCIVGMKVSTELQCATATRQYILDCHDNQYDIPSRAWTFILRQLVYHATRLPTPPNPPRFGAWRRLDALRLLTGCKTGGIDDPEEEREVSIIDCIRPGDTESLQAYIEALGGLRASECLWRLWLQLQANNYRDTQPPESLSLTFIRAFLRARDVQRAVRIIVDSGISASALGIFKWHLVCRLDGRYHLGCSSDPAVLRTLLSNGHEGSFFELFGTGYGKEPMDFLPLIEDALDVRWIPTRTPLENLLNQSPASGEVRVNVRRAPGQGQVSWVPGEGQEGVHIRKEQIPIVRYHS